MELSVLEKFNTWWLDNKLTPGLLKKYKRQVYGKVRKYLDKRLIILLYGLRRMGKTTIIYQLISDLLKSVEGKYILYFSFDEHIYQLDDVLDTYQNSILHQTFEHADKTIYIFLDEIQKLDDWENKIKIYYDLYPNLKFIITGSASISIRKKSSESLAGRLVSVAVDPLSFLEYLEINNFDIDKIKKNPDLYKRELLPMLDKYMKYGTFPELAFNEESEYARTYIRETVIDRIIYRDIEEEFHINDVGLLKSLITIVADKPGLLLNFKSISENLGRDQRTVSNYFEYLQYGMLVNIIYNYRENEFISMRKLKKCYPSTPNIIYALTDKFSYLMPYIMENLVLMKLKTSYFYRNSYEVDFIYLQNDKIIPVEVKKGGKTLKQIQLFIKKYGDKVDSPVIVTFDEESQSQNINSIPLWKFLIL